MLLRNASTEHFEEADSVADRPYRTLFKYDSSSVAQSPIRNWRLVIAKKHKSVVSNPETADCIHASKALAFGDGMVSVSANPSPS
jgi:hypothetical protein